MVIPPQQAGLEELLAKIAESLDIPDYLYEEAILKYEDVGKWLADNESDLNKHAPNIYPQGSFRLGTVIRPISDEDEYDVDLVCHLTIEKERVSQMQLKDMVGKRLKAREDILKIIKPSRRCWTLNYPKQFHMDVLPAIPNEDTPPTGILLTDTELTRWQNSNPIAFVEWFYGRMKTVFQERRMAFAKLIQMDIDQVPEWQIKTPLQRSIQLLKRHRDIYFQKNPDNKPASIIITTLAAHAYRNQSNLIDAMLGIVQEIPRFIENRNGQWWVANPVDSEENFADKWNEKPERQRLFFVWIKQVQQDFSKFTQALTLLEAANTMSPSFGQQTIVRSAQSLGLKLAAPNSQMTASTSPETPAIADSTHCLNPQWPINSKYKAQISGTVRLFQHSTKTLWALTDRPLPKDVWLRFTVSTNTPLPYEVKWQVVNTGREAMEAKQLRGDFYLGDTGTSNVRWERTLYAGTHWVEAFVIKNEVCVAKTGKKLIRIRK